MVEQPNGRGRGVPPRVSFKPRPGTQAARRMVRKFRFQMLLGIIQQVALVPVLLHFWNGEELAAWLVIYAIGNLVLIADCGLQFRAINRFFAFKSGADCDGAHRGILCRDGTALMFGSRSRSSPSYCFSALVVSPSTAFRFEGVTHFNAAFVVMCAGNAADASVGPRCRRSDGARLYATGRLAAEFCDADRAGRATDCDRCDRKPVLVRHPLPCRNAAGEYHLSLGHRCAALHPYLGKAARRGLDGLDDRPTSQGGAVRHRERDRVLHSMNLPVLAVSALVADRGSRAMGIDPGRRGLLRALCLQATLPLAAELGQ